MICVYIYIYIYTYIYIYVYMPRQMEDLWAKVFGSYRSLRET